MKKIDIEISNMLRIQSAKLTLQPGKIVTVTGPNEAGKTSIATLVGAILCRNENPLGYGRATGKIYLRDDSESGHAAVSADGEPIARWDAVSGDVQNFDVENTIQSTTGALGLVKFTHHMTPAAKTALWESYFLPPAKQLEDQVRKQLSGLVNNSTLVNQICELVAEGDMSTALKVYEGRRKDAKALWKKVTGEDHGMAKAPDWIPDGWSASLDGCSIEDLEEELAIEQDNLRNLQIGEAVSAQQIAEGVRAVAEIKEIESEIVTRKQALSELDDKSEKAGQPLSALKKELSEKTAELHVHMVNEPKAVSIKICGSCGTKILPTTQQVMPVYDENSYAKQREKWETERDKLELEYEDIKARQAELQEKIKPITAQQAELRGEIQERRGRIAVLEGRAVNADKQVTEVDVDALSKCEQEIMEIRKRIGLLNRRQEAYRHHQDVVSYDEVVKVLGPKGVRALAVSAGMAKFRKVLANVHKVTDWSEVCMDDSYNLSIGGRKFMEVCGETPRLRAQYAVQIAIAIAKNEPVVIFDMVDHLQQVHQKTLYTLIQRICKLDTAPAFLVCGTTGHFKPTLFRSATHYAVEDGVLNAG